MVLNYTKEIQMSEVEKEGSFAELTEANYPPGTTVYQNTRH